MNYQCQQFQINYKCLYVSLSSSTILEFFPARLAMLPYGLDSNVTKPLANLAVNLDICILLFCQ